MTIAARTIAEARELLARGISQREVARRLGVSRGLIHDVANGRRELGAPDEEAPDYVRCPTCGGKVIMPCAYCAVHETEAPPAEPVRQKKDARLSAELDGFYELSQAERERQSLTNQAEFERRQQELCDRCDQRHDPLDECPETEE